MYKNKHEIRDKSLNELIKIELFKRNRYTTPFCMQITVNVLPASIVYDRKKKRNTKEVLTFVFYVIYSLTLVFQHEVILILDLYLDKDLSILAKEDFEFIYFTFQHCP